MASIANEVKDNNNNDNDDTTLDVLLNKELLSIVFNFMPSADIKNILACNLVCKTWSKILEACDDIWYNLFFSKFADYHRYGFSKYDTMDEDEIIEQWDMYNFTWVPGINSITNESKKQFFFANVTGNPNINHNVYTQKKREDVKREFIKRCKFISTCIINKLQNALETGSPFSSVSLSFLARHPESVVTYLTKLNNKILGNRLAYAYRKPFNYRCDILLWIGIHRQTYTLLNKMVDDHHVSPFTTINNINTNMSTDGILKNENDNNNPTRTRFNYQWDDLLQIFVPFSNKDFIFPYGQIAIKHELDRLADTIKNILIMKALLNESTYKNDPIKCQNAFQTIVNSNNNDEIILSRRPPHDVIKDVSEILFERCCIKGSTGNDYYKRENSFLDHILLGSNKRKGIPISLTILFLAITQRLGMKNFHPVGMPGHFISSYKPTGEDDGIFICAWPVEKVIYIDAFDKGRILDKDDCFQIMRRVMGAAMNFQNETRFMQYLQPTNFLNVITRISANICRTPTEDASSLFSLYSFISIRILIWTKQANNDHLRVLSQQNNIMDSIVLRIARLQILCRMLKLNTFVREISRASIFPSEGGNSDLTLLGVARSDISYVNQNRESELLRHWMQLNDDQFDRALRSDPFNESRIGIIDIGSVQDVIGETVSL